MQDSALALEEEAQQPDDSSARAITRALPACSPFVVGVTGHRNLAERDLERARAAVHAFLETSRRLLPDTELTVMLGMAAGGDLLVAETALELGIRVEAVLPMPMLQFVADFDDRNRRLFMKLMAHPRLHRTELLLAATGTRGSSPSAAAGREAAYRNLAEVLIRKSHLMLALWDGKPSRRLGGTTETVLRYLRVHAEENCETLHMEVAAPDSVTDTQSRFLYWMPMAPGGDAVAAAATPCFLASLGETILRFDSRPPEALRRRFEEFNDYNRDFCRVAADVRTPPGDSLLEGVPMNLLDRERQRLEQINAEYCKADTLALHYQKRSDGLFGVFGIFAFVVGCLYLVYDKLGENQAILLVYLVTLLGSLLVYRLFYTKIWFVKHLRYRALAETMRVMFYLCVAGVDLSVDAAAILALSSVEQFDGFSWLGFALKNVAPVCAAPEQTIDPRRGEFVRDAWVGNQYRYFLRKSQQLEHKSRKISQWQVGAVAITIVMLLTRLLFAQSMHNIYVTPGVPLQNLLTLVGGVAALFLGAWKLHQTKMATRELIWQYKNQLAHFSRSSAELEWTATAERRTEVLIELGKRSLMENYLWTIHRYHREHAPPTGA